MSIDPAQTRAFDRPGPTTRRTAHQHSRGAAPGWRLGIAVALGLIAAALLAAIAWHEYHPRALVEAEAEYRRNDFAAALRTAQGHLARRPFSRSAALTAARCLSRLDRPEQAEPYYQKAGRLDVDDQHTRAFAMVLTNRREQAIRAYQEILAARPDDVLALRRLAAVQISQTRWSEALALANRLIKIPAGVVIGHTLAGVVHHDTGNPEQAVFEFERVLELDPGLVQMPLTPRAMFWTDFGQDLLTMGRADEAQRFLHRALRECGDAKIADRLGLSYYQQGAIDDAELCWRLALQWEPDRAETLWRIGRLELQRGRPEEAVTPLRRAVELEPNAVGPVYSLSIAYRRLDRLDEAERLRKQADRLRAGSPPPAGGMGALPGPIQ
jgi:tetratricopeptide (TPR) repeat protein